MGINGILTKRNTPTVAYLTNIKSFFWDGRASSLEEQATIPITNPHEMGLTMKEVISRLSSDTSYVSWFNEVYQQLPDSATISSALAAFQQTLVYRTSPYDLYIQHQDSSKMSAKALHGVRLFFGKARCSQCHKGADFADGDFRNIGINSGDAGRVDFTENPEDLRKFKTPTLRNI